MLEMVMVLVWVVHHWPTRRRAWVLAWWRQEPLQVRLARRLAGVRCVEVRVRPMLPGQQGLLRVQLWQRRVDRWRRHHRLRRMRRVRVVQPMRRRHRLLERLQVVLCCLAAAVGKRLVLLLARVLVVRVGRLNRRVWPLVQWCLVVVVQLRRRVLRVQRRRDLEVAASVRLNWRQAKQLVRQ